jgi:hypothetical protein
LGYQTLIFLKFLEAAVTHRVAAAFFCSGGGDFLQRKKLFTRIENIKNHGAKHEKRHEKTLYPDFCRNFSFCLLPAQMQKYDPQYNGNDPSSGLEDIAENHSGKAETDQKKQNRGKITETVRECIPKFLSGRFVPDEEEQGNDPQICETYPHSRKGFHKRIFTLYDLHKSAETYIAECVKYYRSKQPEETFRTHCQSRKVHPRRSKGTQQDCQRLP